MELIVISAPWSVTNEGQLLNRLFEAGLRCFHLRKPDWDINQFRGLLREVNPCFHQRIVLHQQHLLINEIGLKGVHFPEHERLQTEPAAIMGYQQGGLTVSTSIHDLSLLSTVSLFDYVFFGPVFNSISKPGYPAGALETRYLNKKNVVPKVIALGGIDAYTIQRIREMPFNGAAVLGHLWMEPAKTVERFEQLTKELQHEFK